MGTELFTVCWLPPRVAARSFPSMPDPVIMPHSIAAACNFLPESRSLNLREMNWTVCIKIAQATV